MLICLDVVSFFSKLYFDTFDSYKYLLPHTIKTFCLQWDGYAPISIKMIKMPIQIVIMQESHLQNNAFHSLLFGTRCNLSLLHILLTIVILHLRFFFFFLSSVIRKSTMGRLSFFRPAQIVVCACVRHTLKDLFSNKYVSISRYFQPILSLPVQNL